MKASGNVVIITGGSSGIGLALAKRFLLAGNSVLITGRDQQKLTSLKEQHADLNVFCCDLSDLNGVTKLVQHIKQNYAEFNILINNAGVQYQYSLLHEHTTEMMRYEVGTNFLAPIQLAAMLISDLGRQPSAAIINVSSGLFLAPKKSAPVYCATKAALHSFSKSLRYQLEDTTIKVFEIIPALVDTPMTEASTKNKITSEQLVDEFFKNFTANRYESYIGKTKLLKIISRLAPKLADKLMKNN